MVRIERNVSIVDYTTIDDSDIYNILRDNAADHEANNGSYFQFEGVLESLDWKLVDAADEPSDYHRIKAQINSITLFMAAHNLKETDYYYFWW